MFKFATAVVAGLLAGGASAQKAVPAALPPVGEVRGNVILADTQRPARFAEVQLLRKPDASEIDKDGSVIQVWGTGKAGPQQVVMVNGRTRLDGSFTIGRVPVGEYYVVAVVAGYLPPWSRVKDKTEAKDLSKVMANVPVVRVTTDRVAEANVRLERGGVIGGRVQFEDGSPVVGMFLQAEPVLGLDDVGSAKFGPLGNLSANFAFNLRTDDDGRFRLPGLRPGKYLVKVQVEMEGSSKAVSMGNGGTSFGGRNGGARMAFYFPGKLKKSAAKEVEIKEGEQRLDLTLDIDLAALHHVEGRVVAKEDQHAVNHGRVKLTDTGEKEFSLSADVMPDGTFHFEYVPAGTYSMDVSGADVDDPEPLTFDTKQTTLRGFAPVKMDVIVGDHDQRLEDVQLEAKGKN